MRLEEDNTLSFKKPSLSGSFEGADTFATPGDLKLKEIQICLNPLQLELSFDEDGKIHMGYIVANENTPASQSRLEKYRNEIQKKLKGKSWEDVLRWNFKFDDATRLSR